MSLSDEEKQAFIEDQAAATETVWQDYLEDHLREGENVKEAILKEMSIGMFSALADETAEPYVAEVDERYNEVEGEPPDGETAEGDMNRREFGKGRRYVDSPEEVPEGYEVQEGPQGGLYYETEGEEAEGSEDNTPTDETILPDWHEDAEKPPWPEEPAFVEPDGGFPVHENSILQVQTPHGEVEGWPLDFDSEEPNWRPSALWTKDGDVVQIPTDETEITGVDVRTSHSLKGRSPNWEDVEWGQIPDEVAPSAEEVSDWNRTSDVFGRDMWVNEETGDVRYGDELPDDSEGGDNPKPPWPDDPLFDSQVEHDTGYGTKRHLVRVRGDDNQVVEGYLLDASPYRVWTETGEVMELGHTADVIAESVVTRNDLLDHFPEYDPEEHREPREQQYEETDTQVNDDVGSDEQEGNYVDSSGRVHTEQEEEDTAENETPWSFEYTDPDDLSPSEAFDKFRDGLDRDEWKPADDAIASWVNSPGYAPEFQDAGAQITGNEKGAPGETDRETIESLKRYSDFTTEFLKERGDDSITVYRFVDDAIADEVMDGETSISPKSAASWSDERSGAVRAAQEVRSTSEDGVILEAEIPAENVIATHETNDVFHNQENEVIAALPDDVDLTNLKYHGYGDYEELPEEGKSVKGDIVAEALDKARRYIDNPSEAPDDVEVQEGPQGGLYYESGSVSAEPTTDDEGERILNQLSELDRGDYESAGEICSQALSQGANTEAVAKEIASQDHLSAEQVGRETARRVANKDIEGFDHEAKSILPKEKSKADFWKEVQEKFKEKVDEESAEVVDDAWHAWIGPVFHRNSAPIFQLASQLTGNETMPSDVEEVLEMDVSEEEMEAMEELREHTIEIAREMYGDTVTVYRGLSPGENRLSETEGSSASDKIRDAVSMGEDVEIEHRAAESWSLDPTYAKRFSMNDELVEVEEGEEWERVEKPGVMLETEIPVEQIIFGSIGGYLNHYENEFAMAHEGAETYSPDEIYTYEEIEDGEETVQMLLDDALEMVGERE